MNFRIFPLAILISLLAAWATFAQSTSKQSSSTKQGSSARQGSSMKQGSSSNGSSTNGSAARQAPPTKEMLEFEGLRRQLNVNRDEIAKLRRTMPVGFPDQVVEAQNRIEAIEEQSKQIEAQLYEKAKAAFVSSEQPNQLTSQILVRELQAAIEPRQKEDRFEPEKAIELVNIMLEKFPNDIRLLRWGFLANFSIERFDSADVVLAKMEKVAGGNLPTAYREALEKVREKYQREIKIRRIESSTDDLPRVRLVTTEGDIIVELFENHAPNTVANFISLVSQQFYNDKLFHLVRPGQYAISGSPGGDGTGDPGYHIRCECTAPEIRHHMRGTLTMLTPGTDRGGSQFMILHQPNTRLFDGKYTAFGRVIEGMDVVMNLKNIDLSGRQSTTADVSKIIRAEVIRKRSHPYVPEKIEIVRSSSVAPLLGTENSTAPGQGSGSATKNPTGVVAPGEGESTGSFDLLLQQEKK